MIYIFFYRAVVPTGQDVEASSRPSPKEKAINSQPSSINLSAVTYTVTHVTHDSPFTTSATYS